jgi:hypothetical protein
MNLPKIKHINKFDENVSFYGYDFVRNIAMSPLRNSSFLVTYPSRLFEAAKKPVKFFLSGTSFASLKIPSNVFYTHLICTDILKNFAYCFT